MNVQIASVAIQINNNNQTMKLKIKEGCKNPFKVKNCKIKLMAREEYPISVSLERKRGDYSLSYFIQLFLHTRCCDAAALAFDGK